MQFSVKFAGLAFLINAALIAAVPLVDSEGKVIETLPIDFQVKDSHLNQLSARWSQQECEAACTLAGLQGTAWNQCVQNCVRGNYPTPPPSPPRPKPQPKPVTKGKRELEARWSQQECEAACTLAGLQGAAWNQCVQNCVRGNYPTPPPSPPRVPKPRPAGKGKRELVARYSQQECEAACTLAGFQGPAWNQCVQNCVRGNYPTPPPSPPRVPKPRPAGKGKRDLVARYSQQECEAACTLAGFQGAAWNQCVQNCVQGNYPTPPPSPPRVPKPRPAGKGKRDLVARYTQQECEAACTLAGFQGAAWNQCVQNCVAGNYPTPPPSPPRVPRPRPAVKGKRNIVARYSQQECEAACTLAGLQGAAWNQCVQNCVLSNYPTPPPSPPKAGKGLPKKMVRDIEEEDED